MFFLHVGSQIRRATETAIGNDPTLGTIPSTPWPHFAVHSRKCIDTYDEMIILILSPMPMVYDLDFRVASFPQAATPTSLPANQQSIFLSMGIPENPEKQTNILQ